MSALPQLLSALFLIFLTQSAVASAQQAPEWDVSEWINSNSLSLKEQHGKVVVIDFFQLWCPGCNHFSLPLMDKWENEFAKQIEAGELLLVSIHTVFEGHDYQNPERLRSFVKEKGIRHPVGVDRHLKGEEIPETMKRWQTRGTPEMAIVDKQGVIRFQKFGGFDPETGSSLIRQLLAE